MAEAAPAGGPRVFGRPFEAQPYTASELEKARTKRDKILERFRGGQTVGGISNSLRLRSPAIRKVLVESGFPEAAPPGGVPEPIPDEDLIPESEEPIGRRSVEPGPPAPLEDHDRPQDPSMSASSAEPEAQSPPPRSPPQGAPPMREPPPAWTPSGDPYAGGAQPTNAPPWQDASQRPLPQSTSPLDMPYQTGTVYDILYQILIENQVPQPKAVGVVRRFRHYAPYDYPVLDRIMMEMALTPPARTSTLGAYKEETQGMTATPGSTGPGQAPETSQQVISRVRRRAGLPDTGSDQDPTLARARALEAEQTDLLMRQTRAEVALKEKELSRLAAPPPSPDDEMVTIVVNLGGVPMEKRIKERDRILWAPYMARPAAQASTEEMPSWARELRDENRLLKDRITKNDEEARRKSELEAIERRHAEEMRLLREDIARRNAVPNGPTDSEKRMQEQLDRLRDEATKREIAERDRRLDDNAKRMEELRTRVDHYTTIEGQAELRSRFDKQARDGGYIPKSESETLNEERLKLEAQRNQIISESKARTDLMDLGKDKLKETGGLRKGLIDQGAPKMIMDVVRDQLGGAERMGNAHVETGDEDLDRLTEQLERQNQQPEQQGRRPPQELPTEGGEQEPLQGGRNFQQG